MSRSNESCPREPSQLRIRSLRFVREHDGKPERLLKDRLMESFKQRDDVQRAYLAQISTGNQAGVALCLKARHGPDPNIVLEVGGIFAGIFVEQEHLEILFLSETQEAELRNVCSPFYSESEPAR